MNYEKYAYFYVLYQFWDSNLQKQYQNKYRKPPLFQQDKKLTVQ